MGMTDAQFKAMLIDELENWERVHEMALKLGSEDMISETQKQIDKINEKLKF